MTEADLYSALRADERRRLEQFAAAFEDVDPLDYETIAGFRVDEDAIDSAREGVLRAIGTGPSRRAAVRAAEARFVDAANRALARRLPLPQTLIGLGVPSPRLEDRVRLVQSLERAVAAVIVWPDLTPSEQMTLAGPWAPAIERALGPV